MTRRKFTLSAIRLDVHRRLMREGYLGILLSYFLPTPKPKMHVLPYLLTNPKVDVDGRGRGLRLGHSNNNTHFIV